MGFAETTEGDKKKTSAKKEGGGAVFLAFTFNELVLSLVLWKGGKGKAR